MSFTDKDTAYDLQGTGGKAAGLAGKRIGWLSRVLRGNAVNYRPLPSERPIGSAMGIFHDGLDEEVKAFAVKKTGVETTQDELIAWYRN